MYKVFINNKRLILANSKEIIDYGDAAVVCLKKPETVNAVIQNHLLKSNTCDFIILSADDKKLIETFESNYEMRVAAGGWAWNEHKELLMIFRENHWDLPKGHLDEGETIEECAMREVEEETGVSNLEIDSKIAISRHIYEYKGQMVLKITHWFQMKTKKGDALVPQIEEGIEKAEWVTQNDIDDYFNQSWESLKEVYKSYTKS
jgi:ADP-ribose pyrophosphatase YjhB (NUDIX family)